MVGREEERVKRIARDEQPAVRLLADPGPFPGGEINPQKRLGDRADRPDPLGHPGAGLQTGRQKQSVGTVGHGTVRTG